MAFQVEWRDQYGWWVKSSIFATYELADACLSARGDAEKYRVVEVDEPFEDNPMITRWFGEPWPFPTLPAPVCEDYRLHISTPEHEDCIGCDEPILPSESGTRMPMMGFPDRQWAYQHAECGLRSVMCPIELGLVDDPSGRHEHDWTKRRDEARMLMDLARNQVRR